MDVIPAIDLVDGRVVRLVQGRFDASTDFGADAEYFAFGLLRRLLATPMLMYVTLP